MSGDLQPPPLMRPALPDDDPVALLAREAGRRAAARLRDKARRRAGQAGQAARSPQAAAGEAPAPASLHAGPAPTARVVGEAPAAPVTAMAAAVAGEASIDTPSPRPHRTRPRGHSTRRLRRRQRTAVAAALLGTVSVLAVSWLYQWLGRAPPPFTDPAWSIALADRAPAPTMVVPAPLPVAPPPVAAPAPALDPGAALPAPTAATAVATPSPPPAPGQPRVSAAGRAAAAVLPYIPGSQVVESDAEPQQAPGGGTTWAATLTSADPVDKAAAYYRQLLSADARPGGAALTEVTPGPGQVLLSLGNPADGSHSAVWIGQSDGQVLIRLMRTQGSSALQ